MTTAEKTVTIMNHTGLHTRPAKQFVKLAGSFQAEIRVVQGGKQANAKSFISVISLGAPKGTDITIQAEGEDAEQAVYALAELVNTKFGEDE